MVYLLIIQKTCYHTQNVQITPSIKLLHTFSKFCHLLTERFMSNPYPNRHLINLTRSLKWSYHSRHYPTETKKFYFLKHQLMQLTTHFHSASLQRYPYRNCPKSVFWWFNFVRLIYRVSIIIILHTLILIKFTQRKTIST